MKPDRKAKTTPPTQGSVMMTTDGLILACAPIDNRLVGKCAKCREVDPKIHQHKAIDVIFGHPIVVDCAHRHKCDSIEKHLKGVAI